MRDEEMGGSSDLLTLAELREKLLSARELTDAELEAVSAGKRRRGRDEGVTFVRGTTAGYGGGFTGGFASDGCGSAPAGGGCSGGSCSVG